MIQALRNELDKRSWWMNLIFAFCVYMTFIYMPFDIFYKPMAEDEEVWFGFTLHGFWAKATAPLHWLIYAGLAVGFFRMSRWMWPWAAVYAAQIALSMLVWNLLDPRGGGWVVGLIAGAIFLPPTVALWRARGAFQPPAEGAAQAA
ncbi:MAG: hypothetical protein F4149_02995 [Gammaproteobacteria bacterium]|nr:hypothetical protein [Gammaproteobacteria bacterium]MYK83728.1 hypothetical protein [Gammaproteobacteria bacterium]